MYKSKLHITYLLNCTLSRVATRPTLLVLPMGQIYSNILAGLGRVDREGRTAARCPS